MWLFLLFSYGGLLKFQALLINEEKIKHHGHMHLLNIIFFGVVGLVLKEVLSNAALLTLADQKLYSYMLRSIMEKFRKYLFKART